MSAETKQKMIEAVKGAIMVELKGQQLYSHAVTQAQDPEAKVLFETLAADEEEHVRILEHQFKFLVDEGQLDLKAINPAELDHGSHPVIDDAFKKKLRGNPFEMAVIGIGCDLEKKAVAYYEEQAGLTEDADLKQLFTWLATWEEGHLKQLIELERLYQDAYWADQGFSPM